MSVFLLLSTKSNSENSVQNQVSQEFDQVMEDEVGNTTLSSGRPSLLQSVPDFLNFTLERHADVSAHRRRRSDEDAVTGMTLELLSDTVSSQIGRKV